MKWKIPLFKIYWDENDIKLVEKTIKRGMRWSVGENIEKFESMTAEYIGTKYCVTFNSGTSALHAILLAYDINKNSEIIVPSFTFIATSNSSFFVGAKPVFADIEEKTFGLDPNDVEKKITKKTKVIMPIHYGGCPCRVDKLKEIAEEKDLILIEDASESFGAKIKNKKVGTFGNSSVFSFCQNKIITTGEGGCVVTDSKDIYERLKLIRSHGRQDKENYFTSVKNADYVMPGYNFRISDISAALGITQIEKVNKIIQMRRKNAEYMTKRLSKINGIITQKAPDDFYHVYQMYTIQTEQQEERDKLIEFLAKKGIMSKVCFYPVHKSQFYKNIGYRCKLDVTEKISSHILTLPMYPSLTENEMDCITNEINNFFEGIKNE